MQIDKKAQLVLHYTTKECEEELKNIENVTFFKIII